MSIAKNKLVNLEDAQLLYNDLRQRIESGGGGGGQQFMVTIAEDSDTLSSDKTATQIINAIEAGNTLYISYPDVYDSPTFALPLGYVNDPEGDGIGVGLLTLAGLTEWYVFEISDDDGSTAVQVDYLNIEGKIYQLSGTIAPDYTNLSFPVAAGQLCYYDGGLYKAKQAIATSESWTSAHWDSTTVEAELSSLSTEISGKVSDVKVNGTSVVDADKVAQIPKAASNQLGVVKVGSGLAIAEDGTIYQDRASGTDIKAGTAQYKPIVALFQHAAVFFGLSKVAGVDLANETVTLGTYPATAKTAIQTMLGVEPCISLIEEISGTTPSITALPNVRYVCGEVSTISITPPSSGTCDILFESGSTAALLTVPNTVKFPSWFDATDLDANVVYEIMIADGVYGSVMSWAS